MRNKWTSGWDSNWFYYRVTSEQTTDSRGKRTYPLSSKMMELNYLMEVPSSCGPEDIDFVAFVEVASLGVVMWQKNFLLAACDLLVNSLVFK
jgi:hypothetical protein